MRMKRFALLSLLVAVFVFAGTNVSAAEAAFFKGKAISFICPYPPGGGYDRIVRSLAIQFQERLGAKVIVNNVPGAAGLRGANVLYQAKPDGLTIGLLPGTALILGSLGNVEGTLYDFPNYSFIGRVTAEQKVLFVNPKCDVKSLDDLVHAKRTIKFGEQGASQDAFVFLVGLKYAMNLPMEVVVGYDGTHAIELAVMNGEVDGGFGAVGSRYPKIHSGDLRAIAILGSENPQESEYRNLPLLPGNYPLVPGGKAVMRAMVNINEAHRVLAAPPGMSKARLQVLEDTLKAALSDPELIRQWDKEGREAKFMAGQDYLNMIKEIFDAPPKSLLQAWQKEKEKIKY